jgi:hypothetical protein
MRNERIIDSFRANPASALWLIFRKHPLLSAAQVVAFVVALPAFFSTINFIVAVTPEQARDALPAGWSAGVMNHGDYYHWWTIQERPYFFGASLFCLVMSLLFIWGSIFWLWRLDRKSGFTSEKQVP